MAVEDDVTRWQKIKGMGICLGDSESDCSTNLRFSRQRTVVLNVVGAAPKFDV